MVPIQQQEAANKVRLLKIRIVDVKVPDYSLMSSMMT